MLNTNELLNQSEWLPCVLLLHIQFELAQSSLTNSFGGKEHASNASLPGFKSWLYLLELCDLTEATQLLCATES